ncbi:RepB family protein [Escherichia coli]
MVEYCEREGITQAQFVEKIIKDELQRLDITKVKTLLCGVAC